MASEILSLVADVGGTNTRVALANGPHMLAESVTKYPNVEFDSLSAVLETYMSARDVDCDAAAVAIAGPVRDGHGTLTNLDWSIDIETLARITKAELASVLNDLQAQGHATGRVAQENLHSVIDGSSQSDGTRLVIGIGTGFNAAVIYDTPLGRFVPPSEAGHVDAPRLSEEDLHLGQALEASHGFASVEDILSGRGLENVYAWQNGSGGRKTAAEIMQSVDSDPVAKATIEYFVRMMGTVAGNLALVHLPFGGIWLIGGVSRAMLPYLKPGFQSAFRAKGRFSSFMDAFSVDVVQDDFAALSGLAAHLDELFAAKQKMTVIG
jgi:glucokinase